MGIWVVVLEAVRRDDPETIEPEDLDNLAEALAEAYPRVTGGPAFFQAEFWVEEVTAGGAVMAAQRQWQAAVREIGMPPWDVVRAEARDAHAIDAGLVDWTPEPDDDEIEDEEPLLDLEDEEPLIDLEDEEPPEPAPPRPAPKRAARKKAAPKRTAAKKAGAPKKAAAKRKAGAKKKAAAPAKAPLRRPSSRR